MRPERLLAFERIANAVDGADIITLQEVERNWQHSAMLINQKSLGGS